MARHGVRGRGGEGDRPALYQFCRRLDPRAIVFEHSWHAPRQLGGRLLTVQLISKPVAPPWHDATNVLVRSILTHRQECRYRFFGTPASSVLEGPYVRCDQTSDTSHFQPTLSEHLRTLLGIARARADVNIYHCLFTPNPRASQTLKLVLKAMRRPVIHTVCSSPTDWATAKPLLFADVVVTVSDWARRQLEQLGMNNVRHIRPGIAIPEPRPDAIQQLRDEHDLPSERPCLVFSGDYEFSGAHPALLAALPEIVRAFPDVILVFACRTKTAQALDIEASVRHEVDGAGLTRNVRFLRHVSDFSSLLALATVVLFPAVSLHKKMDIPLTLLEAMAQRRPVVATAFGPLAELMAEPIGVGIPPRDAFALANAILHLLRHPAEAAAMGDAGHALVRDRYSAAEMTRAYEDLYLATASHRQA